MPTKTIQAQATSVAADVPTDSMAALVQELGPKIIPFHLGEIVEVEVLSVSKTRILVNVQNLALGFIPQREFSVESADLEIGQKLLAYILMLENQDGYVVLSLKRADRERLWRTIAEQSTAGSVITVKVANVNRGGLVIDYGGLEGFLPISQLSSRNYSRVAGTTGEFSANLRQFIGKTIRVKIISFDEHNRKLIFSEKAAGQEEVAARIKELEVGQELEGTVTGITDFGLFVDLGGLEGLVHISEVSWERIEDLRSIFKSGDAVKVQVIGIEENRVSLSIKRLLPDPWQEAIKKYQVGSRVEGEVTRLTPYGAFVRLDSVVEGLVHVSEVLDREHEPEKMLEQVLIMSKHYPFIVLSIDPQAHRIALSYKSAQTESK